MDYPRKVHADVDDKQLKEISIGDMVEIVTVGKVCELRDSDSYDLLSCGCPTAKDEKKKGEKKKIPASITVDVEETLVREHKGDYTRQMEDGGEG